MLKSSNGNRRNRLNEPPCDFCSHCGCPACFQKRTRFTLYEFPRPSTNILETRSAILQEIQNSIEMCGNQEHPYRRMIVLHGFGGMGKSEVAKLWAQKFHTLFNYVVWFDAASESKLLAGFRTLANKLKVQFETKADLPTVYTTLSQKCNHGIFIFDNAQRLTELQGEFGIQPYLYFYILPRKPVVIITSRRGDTFWGLSSERIPLIHISCFSAAKESLGYENHPMGTTPEFEKIVEAAFSPTVENMLIQGNGSLGRVLLDIITILGPSPIHAELVNAIYRDLPNSSSQAYGDFTWSNLAMPVRKGLKALLNFSIIDVATSTETSFNCERRFLLIFIHPIIHDNSLRSINATENAATLVGTVCNFFEKNDRNERYFKQMKTILELLIANQFGKDALHNSVMMLCKLMLEGRLSESGALQHLPTLQARADSANEAVLSGILRVVDFYVSKVVPETVPNETFFTLATEISSIIREFGSRPWVFNSCVYVLNKMFPSSFPMEPTDDLQKLGDLMLCTWRASKPHSYRHCPILCAVCLSNAKAIDIAGLISTVLSVIHEDDGLEFFQDLVKLRTFFLKSRGSWFIIGVLSSIVEDLFTKTLGITVTRSKMKLLKQFESCSAIFNHFTHLHPNFLTNSKAVADAVWKYTEFSLDLITTNPYGWELESLHTWDAAVNEVISIANYFAPKSEPEHVALATKKDLETKCKEWLEKVNLHRKDIQVDQDRKPWVQFILGLQGDSVRNFGTDLPFGSLSSIRQIDSGGIHPLLGKRNFLPMKSNSYELPASDGQGSSGENIGVQAGENIHGNAHNCFGAERPNNKKASFPTHEYPPGSEFFCGREEVLQEVEERIMECETETGSDPRIVAIIGLGGMGKSEIAKQLAKRLQPKYDFIFWFNAQRRTELDSEFKRLATNLKIPLPSEDSVVSILPDVYHCLEENYTKAIFIFDDAEQLRAGQGTCFLEEYMMPSFPCKKPVFLITSRYIRGLVHRTIRCIRLDRLSDDESYQCLLKYLHVEDRLLSTSLKETIASLAQRLGGIPLLLSLVGCTVADKADKISLDTIESRVQRYIKLLEGQSLNEVSGESKCEERLQILHSTLLNMETTSEWKIAVELLNIIALLSPDSRSIHAGLVNGIYCGKLFYPPERFCRRFVWEDLETSVSMGLQILMKMSLIEVEKYQHYENLLEHDMVKVHRIIQKRTQNLLISGNESVAPLEKIMRYCERNELHAHHIRFLLEFIIQNDLCLLVRGWLLLLSSQLEFEFVINGGDRELVWKVTDFLRCKEVDPDSDKILCVLEIMMREPRDNREAWSKMKGLLLELTPGFTKRRWVLQLSCKVVTYFQDWILQDGNDADFCDWVVKNWKECKEDYNPDVEVLMCLFRCDSNRDWSKDRELISKVIPRFTSGKLSSTWDLFWYKIGSFIGDCTAEQRIQLLELLVNGPEGNVFASSLQFSQNSSKIIFLECWADDFCGCIIEVSKFPELRSSLLGNKRFVDSFWDITSFFLKHPSSVFRIEKRWEREVVLIGTWCFLFHHNVAVYECFGKKMDSEIEDFLHLRRCRPRGWGTEWGISKENFKYADYIRHFANAKHCSEPTRNWIIEMQKTS